MSGSASSPFASTKETTNYARLCRLLVDAGSQVLRNTFDKIHPPATLHGVLSSPSVHYATLQSLYRERKKVLNPAQWGKLYPAVPSTVSSGSFDITLLTVLLRNICGLSPPIAGWDSLPPSGDTSIADDIARVKYYRNTVFGHASQASIDDITFNTYWPEIREALVRLGGPMFRTYIDNLEHDCVDPDIEEHYRELMKQWKKDDDTIKEKLEEMEERIRDSLEQTRSEMEQMGSEVKEIKERLDTLAASLEENKDEAAKPLQPCATGPCKNGGTCTEQGEGYKCQCTDKFTGKECQTEIPDFKNCGELYKSGKQTDGVYSINPDGSGAFDVFCDQTTAGGGWTVFQKRLHGSVDFYRGWADYKNGFGILTGEFWLGLDKINRLTSSGRYKLRVDLEDTEGKTVYAEYNVFAVGSEGTKYRLSVRNYSGTAGDSLTPADGRSFTTKDRDNDIRPYSNCAVNCQGAWWYANCFKSNLNGFYRNGQYSATRSVDGVYCYDGVD